MSCSSSLDSLGLVECIELSDARMGVTSTSQSWLGYCMLQGMVWFVLA